MAKIKFSNGQIVNFDGNPTEADIEEVAKKLGIGGTSDSKNPVDAPKKPLLDRIAESKISKGIQSFFPGAKLGEAVGTSLAAGGRLLKGDTKGASDILKTQLSPKVVGGDVANIALTTGAMAAPVLKGTTALSTIGKTAAQGAAFGAGQSGAKALSQDRSAGEVGKAALVGGAVSGAISGATSAFGELLKKSGEKITRTVIKPTLADEADGFSMKTIEKHDLGGSLDTMLKKTESKMNQLSTELTKKLAQSDATIDLNDVYEQTAQKLTGNKLKSFGANTSMDRALEQLKGEIADVGNGAITIPDAQVIKQASGKMGAWQFGVSDPDATARQKVYNAFYSTMKSAIEKNSPEGVREINKQLSELIPVSNAIVRRLPVAERNNLLSLQDMITLTASAMNPSALGGFALSLAQKSGAVGNILSKLGPKVSGLAPTLGTVGAEAVPSLMPQSPKAQAEISQSPSSLPDINTLSPEVQRILKMR